jgi:hypothetical protein
MLVFKKLLLLSSLVPLFPFNPVQLFYYPPMNPLPWPPPLSVKMLKPAPPNPLFANIKLEANYYYGISEPIEVAEIEFSGFKA